MTRDPVHAWTTVLAQHWEPRIKIQVMLVTYKGCHVDIDTSCEKVMDLPLQAIRTCLPQLHLLEYRGRMIKVGGELI